MPIIFVFFGTSIGGGIYFYIVRKKKRITQELSKSVHDPKAIDKSKTDIKLKGEDETALPGQIKSFVFNDV